MKIPDEQNLRPTEDELLAAPISVLVHGKAKELYDQERLGEAIDRFKPFQYPEGTLEFSVPNGIPLRSFGEKWLHYSPNFPDWPLTDGAWIRNLVTFPLHRYWLNVRRDYVDPIRDRGFAFGNAGGSFGWYPGERNLKNLLSYFWFFRRPSARTKRELQKQLSSWFERVAGAGIDSEGPIKPAIPYIELRGRRADVHLDLSLTGPRTILYFMLEILRFGHEVACIDTAVLNGDDEAAIRHNLAGIRNAFKFMNRKWTDEDERKHLIKSRGGPPSIAEFLPLSLNEHT